MGETTGADRARSFARLSDGREDGAVSPDRRVAGTHVHGLFGMAAQRAASATQLGIRSSGIEYSAAVDRALDDLASHLEAHLNIDALTAIAGLEPRRT
jgi:adenosylcobyric acid synthase